MKHSPQPQPSMDDITQFLKQESFDFPAGCDPDHGGHDHGDSYTSVRTVEYHGKHIEIHTTYKILVDGEPMHTGAMPLNDGKVHSHDLPQYAFNSAIDMAKALIDLSEKPLPSDELHSLYGNQSNNDSNDHNHSNHGDDSNNHDHDNHSDHGTHGNDHHAGGHN